VKKAKKAFKMTVSPPCYKFLGPDFDKLGHFFIGALQLSQRMTLLGLVCIKRLKAELKKIGANSFITQTMNMFS
jgi:hypothetical protein